MLSFSTKIEKSKIKIELLKFESGKLVGDIFNRKYLHECVYVSNSYSAAERNTLFVLSNK